MKSVIILFTLTILSFGTCSAFSKKENGAGECRLLVNFKSIGTGIDYKTQEKLIKLVESKKLKFESKNWGREGEIKYCFTLSELSSRKQKKFIKKVKNLLINSQNTDFQENTSLTK